ncbi:MAG: hypothetical protein HYY24_15040 [Verrucomicrobia bacterium]|nr:hypothetical protein [Verrucomicrobiota bacterium]
MRHHPGLRASSGRSLRRAHRGVRLALPFALWFALVSTVEPANPPPPRLSILPPTAHGWRRVDAGAVPDAVITLQASSDLKTWTPIAVTHEGLIALADPASAQVAGRFYRAIARTRTAGDDFKNQVFLPGDAFVSSPTFGSDEPRWIKFAILTSEPTRVFFQDTAMYLFHYDFATARLDAFKGMPRAAFDEVALHPANQQVVLGAVLYPPLFPDAQPPPEFGIQFVGLEPYPPETVARLFDLVEATVAGPPSAQAFYIPTFEQTASAQENRAFFESRGIQLSSGDHWAAGDSCYSIGWALGRLTFIPAAEIDAAYADDRLRPTDILLTDGVPAEVPFVAGIISITPATPNSHVAILARSYGVPFVYFVNPSDRGRIRQLAGREVIVRVSPGFRSCEAKVFDVEGQLAPSFRSDLLALKVPPPIALTPKQRLGKISASTDGLTPADIKYFGGKAANYGFLRRTIPQHSPVALALSLDLWDDFLDQTLPGGKTLRQEIHERLSRHSYPPDLAALRADLASIRALFRQTAQFTPAQEEAIKAALTIFEPSRNIRFRSSTNVEDTDTFTGAGLYESFSGCLADDTDADTAGPSLCDPTEANERGVFRAIRRVYASFYNDNAFLERLRHGVNEDQVGMAVLVHHSSPDDLELANGVATVTPSDFSDQAELVTQLGAVSVANPDSAARPEVVHVNKYEFGTFTDLRQHSGLVQLGASVMDWDKDYLDLSKLLFAVADAYQTHFPQKRNPVLDFEYKKLKPGVLQVKQVREIPQPDATASIVPFLLNEPTDYCVFQGEHGEVLANHRLKCRWALATQNVRLTAAALAQSFYAASNLEYHEAGQIKTLAGALPAWPNASHGFSGLTTEDRWSFGAGPSQRTYELRTTLPQLKVSPAESPLFTVRDFELELAVTYATPVPIIGFEGAPSTTKEESVRLAPCPAPEDARILTTRVLTSPRGVRVETDFYWPIPPTGAVAGYTAPLVRFEETRIAGLTTQPIVLRGYYSQTYHPFHHNFAEELVFEPRLEPGLPAATLDELNRANIQLVHGWWAFEDTRLTILGLDGKVRPVP